MSYPRPSVPPPSERPLPARPLRPLEPPPHTDRPALPSPQRRSLLHPSFALTTHLVPAAFPRTTPVAPAPVLPTWSPDKAQWQAAVARTAEGLFKRKRPHNELDEPLNRNALWVCLNRYHRKGRESPGAAKGVTLFVAHANGFPKEIWEPMLQRLIAAHQAARPTYSIDEIWLWEAVNHGDACLINGEKLGWMFDWQDNARDVLQFLLHYLPESPSDSELPTHLTRLPEVISDARKKDGFLGRTLVAVGHSLGGCTVSIAALEHPQLFSALVLVDPIIRHDPTRRWTGSRPFSTMSWGSGAPRRVDITLNPSGSDDARSKFAATPFFAAWDPAVLDMYVAHALYDAPDGTVRLKMPGIQEAAVFSDGLTSFETWDRIQGLDERIEVRWVVPGKMSPRLNMSSRLGISELKVRETLVWRRPANSSNIIIPSAGHLISQEARMSSVNGIGWSAVRLANLYSSSGHT
ncbi:hypothetical protein B0H21DRAFT_821288 [Amylocystis lapponica]|nr:hypothetical protein B0H21DRAFT_821288 [Amylocystis lapponica]